MTFIHERLKPKNWNGRSVPPYAHAKLDGHRVTFFKSADGTVRAFGREARPDLEMLSRFPRLRDHVLVRNFEREAMPKSSMDCEVWVPNKPASSVPSALRGEGDIAVTAFALPWWNGELLDDADPTKIRDSFRGSLWEDDKHFATLLYVDEICDVPSKDALIAAAKERGIEGWVLKRYNYKDWWKVKEVSTVDCVCTGFEPGKGKYLGQCGSLEASVYIGQSSHEMRVVANVSGMDDATRAMIQANDVGRVFEVQYQYVGSGGKLRHPRFVRWRDDKPALECTAEQLSANHEA